jgi:hypothetical protein
VGHTPCKLLNLPRLDDLRGVCAYGSAFDSSNCVTICDTHSSTVRDAHGHTFRDANCGAVCGTDSFADNVVANHLANHVTHSVTDSLTNDLAHDVSNNIFTDHVSDSITNDIAHCLTDRVTHHLTHRLSFYFTNHVPFNIPNNVTDFVANIVANHIAYHITHHVTDHVAVFISNNVTNYIAHHITHHVAHSIANAILHSRRGPRRRYDLQARQLRAETPRLGLPWVLSRVLHGTTYCSAVKQPNVHRGTGGHHSRLSRSIVATHRFCQQLRKRAAWCPWHEHQLRALNHGAGLGQFYSARRHLSARHCLCEQRGAGCVWDHIAVSDGLQRRLGQAQASVIQRDECRRYCGHTFANKRPIGSTNCEPNKGANAVLRPARVWRQPRSVRMRFTHVQFWVSTEW